MHAHTGSIVTIITLLRNTFKHFRTCRHITASVMTLEKSCASRSFKTIIITTLSCRRDPHKTCTQFQARHTCATNLLRRATVKARRSLCKLFMAPDTFLKSSMWISYKAILVASPSRRRVSNTHGSIQLQVILRYHQYVTVWRIQPSSMQTHQCAGHVPRNKHLELIQKHHCYKTPPPPQHTQQISSPALLRYCMTFKHLGKHGHQRATTLPQKAAQQHSPKSSISSSSRMTTRSRGHTKVPDSSSH